MQVILLERVAKLGQMGEVVDVKPGYARNFLLPQGKALTASEANVQAFEGRKTQLEADNLETRKEAEAMGGKLDGEQFIIIRQASDSGALYGSVTTRDAAEAATEGGFTVSRAQVVLQAPIKDLGHPQGHRSPAPRGRGRDRAECCPLPRGGRASGRRQIDPGIGRGRRSRRRI